MLRRVSRYQCLSGLFRIAVSMLVRPVPNAILTVRCWPGVALLATKVLCDRQPMGTGTKDNTIYLTNYRTVRRYKRKTNRATRVPADVIRRAVEHYTTSGDSYRAIARMFNMPRSTLRGYVDKLRNLPDGERLPSNLSVGFSRHM